MPWLSALLCAAVALCLCFVPLFNILGYESAAALGAVLSLVVLVRTTRRFDRGLISGPLDPGRTAGPLQDFMAELPSNLLLVLPPAAVLLLNALRVRNCDIGLGVAFFGVIPAVSVVAAQALAFGVALLPRWRLAAGLAVVAAQTGAFLWRLAWDPPIAGHTWTIGWFAGSIYDEALTLPPALLWARLGVLVGSLTVVLALQVGWLRRNRRTPAGSLAGPLAGSLAGPLTALVLCLAVLLALHIQRAALGIQQDQGSVKAALGGRMETEHFVIYFDPGALSREGQTLLAEDHEFRYAELAAFFQEDPVAWKGRKIDSFVYPNRAVQQRLLDSRNTLVARPWTHQLHVRWEREGDPILSHELAHIFTAPFGRGPLRLSMGKHGLVPNLALIEGVASAADSPPDELTAHQASRAMRELGLAPDLRRLFDPAGFWTQPGRRAYTLVQSFVLWLIQTRGIGELKRAYGSGDLEGVYGKPIDQLVTDWETAVDQVPLTDAERALAQARYRRGSIFGRVCARTIAELDRRADQAEAQGRLEDARARRQQLVRLQPKRLEPQLALARLQRRSGDLDAALAVTHHLLENDSLSPLQLVAIQELSGDLRWDQGAVHDAAATYQTCLADGLDEARQRRLAVKIRGADSDLSAVRDGARRYLIDDQTGANARLWAALQWAQAAPGDPVPRYLVGRMLVQASLYTDAVAWLSGPRGTLSPAALDDERWLVLARAALRAGDLALAEGTYRALLADSTSSRARSLATEGLARVRWRRSQAQRGPTP